jgi:hypothetical protein
MKLETKGALTSRAAMCAAALTDPFATLELRTANQVLELPGDQA